MPLESADKIAERWSNGMASSTEKFRAGVEAVTVNPMQKAAARSDAYLAGVQRAVANGDWARGLNKVSLQDWKQAMIGKGMNRIAGGAAAGKPKMQQFLQKFLPHLQQGLQQLENMPRGGLEANIARANAMMRHNAEFKMT